MINIEKLNNSAVIEAYFIFKLVKDKQLLGSVMQ